jgi:hypothetical protein
MGASLWTDTYLDAMRERGDELADRVVAGVYAKGDVAAVNRLMRSLVENEGIPSEQLTPEVRAYLEQVSNLPLPDREVVERGEDVFGEFGPEILMVLGFYSLPAAYAARKGVQVLYRTAYLEKRPVRRVFETTQMVVDVMAKGGLERGGKGLRTAEKVRLMHAAVRHLLTSDPSRPWDPSFGVPINQEDLAGTLMTFSWVVLDGLDRLGIALPAADQEAYLAAWAAIGRRMGVDESLIPQNVADAAALTQIIRRRQIAPSEEGRALTAALIDGMKTLMPNLLDGMPASMIHFFLDKDSFQGQDVATMLGVPKANWTSIVVRALADVGDLIAWFGSESNEIARIIRFFSREFVEALLTVERGGNRPPFAIPEHLRDLWALDEPNG